MIIVVCKLFFINLVITILANKSDYGQLIKKGKFQMDWNKTEAFMHAFYKLNVPKDKNYRNISKGFVHMYQKELWHKFYEGTKPNDSDEHKLCNDAMNNKLVPNLAVSNEKALEGLFLRLRKDARHKYIKVMQKDYMNYVGPLIKKYVRYTSAKTPSEFCNDIEASALPLPVDENGKVDISLIVEEATQIKPDSNSQTASSSIVDKPVRDFDLNQIPSDDTE